MWTGSFAGDARPPPSRTQERAIHLPALHAVEAIPLPRHSCASRNPGVARAVVVAPGFPLAALILSLSKDAAAGMTGVGFQTAWRRGRRVGCILMHRGSVAVHQDAPYVPSWRECSVGPARAVRDACCRPSQTGSRGACSSAVGRASAALLRRLRVCTRPVIGRSSRYGCSRSCRSTAKDVTPRGLSSMASDRFGVSGVGP